MLRKSMIRNIIPYVMHIANQFLKNKFGSRNAHSTDSKNEVSSTTWNIAKNIKMQIYANFLQEHRMEYHQQYDPYFKFILKSIQKLETALIVKTNSNWSKCYTRIGKIPETDFSQCESDQWKAMSKCSDVTTTQTKKKRCKKL